MKQVTATGTTIEEAVESALQELGSARDQVEISVIDKGKKGLFGVFGSKPAIVKVELIQDPVKESEKFLKNVTQEMDVEVSIETKKDGNDITFNLSGEKIAILIGKRGQTLNSLQYLTHLVANRYSEQYLTIIVDAENYRQRRQETLEQLASRLAERAKRYNKPVKLEPMPSFERKIIHSALYGNPEVETRSEGSEPHRHLVIAPRKNR